MTYLYHGTTMENLTLIAKYGLRWFGRGIFFCKTPAPALDWAVGRGPVSYDQESIENHLRGYGSPVGSGGPSWNELRSRPADFRPVLLRVSSANLRHELMNDEEVYHNSWRIKEHIAPSFIEVKTDSGWIPLERYAR